MRTNPRHTQRRLSVVIGLFSLSVSSAPTFGAPDVPVTPPPASPTALATDDSSPAVQLATIQRDIDWLTQEIASQRRNQSRMSKDDAAAAEQDIQELQAKLERAQASFVAAASDVELPPDESKANKPQKRDIVQEAQELVEPLFDAIRRVSEKPRRIEALRSRAFYLHDRISQIDRAVSGLDRAEKQKTFPAFTKQIENSKQNLLHERDELQVRVTSVDRKLSDELSDHRTVMQVVTQDFSDFIATKGKNLAIALLVFAFTLWGALRLKKIVLHSERTRHRLRGLHRPFEVLYALASFVAAVLASVFTLHFLNDWFMASLVMLGLFLAIWALKTLLHHFIAELRLLLNLGTAQQGERVVWMGIPWLIKTLGFRSILVNEALQGGTVALPAATLSTLLSREPHDNEPWFPSKPGDYVLLDDGVYGQVELQTPEVVVVAAKHYQTVNYLAKNPQNYSRGFELTSDLLIRAEYTAYDPAIDGKLRDKARASLHGRLPQAEAKFKTFEGGLIPGRPGTLRAWLTVACPGEIAVDRDALRRELQVALGRAVRELGLTGKP